MGCKVVGGKETIIEIKAPSVSVIIPVFNCCRFLPAAIESILCQSFRSFEIIVVDDGSTDKSGDAAREFGDKVSYLQQPHSGVSAARNYGIVEAKGTFIAFLDADDLWTKDKLSVQMNYLLAHENIGYVTAKVRHFLEPGFHAPLGFREQLLSSDSDAPLLGTLVARKQVFDVVGGFDISLGVSEDVDWFSRAIDMEIPRMSIDRVLMQKRVHGGNASLCNRSNNKDLLLALRNSIRRKRTSQGIQSGENSD